MLGVIVTILTVILAFMCLVMSLVILMQRPKQEGLGAAFGGSLTDKMLGSGTTDFLQKATVFMGVAFFVLSLTIATLMAYDRNADRQANPDQIKKAAGEEAAAPTADAIAPPVDPTPTPTVIEGAVTNPLVAPEIELPATEDAPDPAEGAPDPAEDAPDPTEDAPDPAIEEPAADPPAGN
ncbi:MAG: preprotein translocase subunit SecG [Verrucomicrobiales bacterium]|jgi:preprotein translocase subunit SecG